MHCNTMLYRIPKLVPGDEFKTRRIGCTRAGTLVLSFSHEPGSAPRSNQ
jgi:hypothetical protein